MNKFSSFVFLFLVLGVVLPTLLIGSLHWLGVPVDWTIAGHLALGGFFYMFFVIIQSCFLTVSQSLAVTFATTMAEAVKKTAGK